MYIFIYRQTSFFLPLIPSIRKCYLNAYLTSATETILGARLTGNAATHSLVVTASLNFGLTIREVFTITWAL